MYKKVMSTFSVAIMLTFTACAADSPETHDVPSEKRIESVTEKVDEQGAADEKEALWLPACVTEEGAWDLDCLNTPTAETCPEGQWLAYEYELIDGYPRKTGQQDCLDSN